MAGDDMAREWRVVQDFPDYEVSNDGLVRRRFSTPTGSPGNPRPAGYILKPGLDHKRRPRIRPVKDGQEKRLSVQVAVLVAEAFIGPRPAGKVLAHWDGNPENNRVQNLRWATNLENMEDRDRHGRTPRGVKHSQAKLTEREVAAIRAMRRGGAYYKDIGARFGISTSVACGICLRKIWKHLP